MKTKLLLFVLISLNFCILSSQVPQGFNYQALAGDVSGNPIRNANLQVKISILSDTILPVTVWEELHSTVRTNAHGIFSLVVGSGVRQPASSVATFNEINWSATPLFIKTQIYYQNVWKNMGSAKLWTVPYAMVAGNLSGSLKKLGVKGVTTSPDSALFEVKNLTGQTVFAVYNEGVRVYVDDGTSKGAKGGFAIGGFGTAKAPPQEYLRVTKDSTRVYVNQSAKGAKGGFAIGGFNITKGTVTAFTSLTPDNYFIGHNSGLKNTTGIHNSFIGYESGMNNTTGRKNVFFGYRSGYSNDTASYNIFIGNETGRLNSTGNYNTFLGFQSGSTNNASFNSFIGYRAGALNTTGTYNSFMGFDAGFSNTTGSSNVFIGNTAGRTNTSGGNNVFIGDLTGFSNSGGGYNAFVGSEAGKGNTTGNYNTFFGYQAGFSSGGSSYSTSIGYKAGYSLFDWQAGTYVGFEAGLKSTGRQNVFVGADAGQAFTTGADNVAIGGGAGSSNDSPVVVEATGSRNAFIGYYTGYKSSSATDNVIVGAQNPFGLTHFTGSYNVYLGVDAGNLSSTGSRNVFVGFQAGLNETGSDKLYIHNNSAATPLLWGDFSLRRLRFNGNTSINGAGANQYFALQINTDADDTYGLVVYGSTWCSSGVWAGSDIRLKKNIIPLKNALSSILSLKGVNYNWNIEEHPDMGFANTKQIGLIAQDVEKVLPELVNNGPDGYKSVDYSKITPVLVEAIKEQQRQIESTKEENQQLKSELQSLKGEIEQIREMLVKSGTK